MILLDSFEPQRTERGWRRLTRRPSSASVVSIMAHVVVGILLINAIQMPAVFDRLLQVDRSLQPKAEKVEFVAIAPTPDTAASPVTTRSSSAPVPRQAPIAVPEANAPLVANRWAASN